MADDLAALVDVLAIELLVTLNSNGEAGNSLHAVAQHHGACAILLATRKKGSAARFYSLNSRPNAGWTEAKD
jgi:hypothetical protein